MDTLFDVKSDVAADTLLCASTWTAILGLRFLSVLACTRDPLLTLVAGFVIPFVAFEAVDSVVGYAVGCGLGGEFRGAVGTVADIRDTRAILEMKALVAGRAFSLTMFEAVGECHWRAVLTSADVLCAGLLAGEMER